MATAQRFTLSMAVGLFVLFATPIAVEAATLRWTQPGGAAVDGFQVHYGSASRQYHTTVDIGSPASNGGVFSYEIVVPEDGRLYVAITAYDGGLVSPFSNEKLYDNPTEGGVGGGGNDDDEPGDDPDDEPDDGGGGGGLGGGGGSEDEGPGDEPVGGGGAGSDGGGDGPDPGDDGMAEMDPGGGHDDDGGRPDGGSGDPSPEPDGGDMAEVNPGGGHGGGGRPDPGDDPEAGEPVAGGPRGDSGNHVGGGHGSVDSESGVVAGAGNVGLRLSRDASTRGSVSLNGVTVRGDIYVWVSPDHGIDRVSFYLDSGREPLTIESTRPFSLSGELDGSTLLPFDTNSLGDGGHALRAEVEFENGTTTVIHSTFVVENGDGTLTAPGIPRVVAN